MKTMLILLILLKTPLLFAQTFENVRIYRVTAIRNSEEQTVSNSNTVAVNTASSLYIPKAFSPNGDGLNDTFGAIVSGVEATSGIQITPGVKKYNIRIFNRWGEMIFESEDINHHWDGKHEGRVVQQDVYVYQLFADIKGNVIKKTGTVTVVL